MLQGRTYTIESEIDSSARKEAVLDVLTDYPSHSQVFSSIRSSKVVARRENEADVLQVTLPFLQKFPVNYAYLKCWTLVSLPQQEGRWSVLWLSGRFQTLVRMREDLPHGRILSDSLKSTVFHSHAGRWQVLAMRASKCIVMSQCKCLQVYLMMYSIVGEPSFW